MAWKRWPTLADWLTPTALADWPWLLHSPQAVQALNKYDVHLVVANQLDTRTETVLLVARGAAAAGSEARCTWVRVRRAGLTGAPVGRGAGRQAPQEAANDAHALLRERVLQHARRQQGGLSGGGGPRRAGDDGGSGQEGPGEPGAGPGGHRAVHCAGGGHPLGGLPGPLMEASRAAASAMSLLEALCTKAPRRTLGASGACLVRDFISS